MTGNDAIAGHRLGNVGCMSWQVDDFERSLTDVAASTIVAYRRDVDAFVTWADSSPTRNRLRVTRLLLRRYLAFLATRRYARRTVARKVAALRRYFDWLRRQGVDRDRSVGSAVGAGRSQPVAEGARPGGYRRPTRPPAGQGAATIRLAVRLRDDAVLELLYGSGLRVAELCGLGMADVDVTRRLVTVWGKGLQAAASPDQRPGVSRGAGLDHEGRAALLEVDSPGDALFLNRRGRSARSS